MLRANCRRGKCLATSTCHYDIDVCGYRQACLALSTNYLVNFYKITFQKERFRFVDNYVQQKCS